MSGAQASRPVGITKGPGETIHEYTLISSDEHRLLKNGEYVYYELDAATNAAAHGLNGAATRIPARHVVCWGAFCGGFR